jgi:hypothetical protein
VGMKTTLAPLQERWPRTGVPQSPAPPGPQPRTRLVLPPVHHLCPPMPDRLRPAGGGLKVVAVPAGQLQRISQPPDGVRVRPAAPPGLQVAQGPLAPPGPFGQLFLGESQLGTVRPHQPHPATPGRGLDRLREPPAARSPPAAFKSGVAARSSGSASLLAQATPQYSSMLHTHRVGQLARPVWPTSGSRASAGSPTAGWSTTWRPWFEASRPPGPRVVHPGRPGRVLKLDQIAPLALFGGACSRFRRNR